MHSYCIDGTNLVRGLGYGGPQFRDQENRDCLWLAAALAELCRRLSGRLEVELFFDGALRPMGAMPHNLRLKFSFEEPADELILDRVRARRWSAGKTVTVVTGDGELGRRAEEEGGRWQKVRRGARLEAVLAAIERRFQR
jgi:hypothetical protein